MIDVHLIDRVNDLLSYRPTQLAQPDFLLRHSRQTTLLPWHALYVALVVGVARVFVIQLLCQQFVCFPYLINT